MMHFGKLDNTFPCLDQRRFIGSTAFTNNSADYGGGILQRNLGEYPNVDVEYPMRLNFPEDPADLVFSGNRGYGVRVRVLDLSSTGY